jgi:multidrug efflux pump subunit AcrA (membrane-fusion protein)
MFARIRVPGSPPYNALLVPEAAIGSEQTRKYLLVVDADNAVRQNYVKLGQAVGGLRVIREGLAASDRVVVNGLMKARPGQKVAPQQENPPSPPESPQAAVTPPSSSRTD